ncbi:restriction endonuclease subunit S [Bariatricus sp. HCP28S3_C2]|uniref:restriction endonuclease subunit S n=2 Tax=Bariatricus TaxID=1924081 RepID=UPI003F8B6108
MGKKTKKPQIRFAGFTDDWEQRKLGDVADLVGGGTPNTQNPEYWDGDIDWYAPAEIADQIYVKTSQRKITEQGYDNSSAKLLPPGTVLFTSRAGIGKTAILTRKGCTNQGFQSIVPHKNELDTYFIFSRTEELKRYGELVGAGSTFVEVSGKQMAAMDLMLPSTIREQQMIGVFFKQLDHLITLHQRKLDKLKSVKKSMLEKMIPQNGEVKPEIRFTGFTDDWEQRKLGATNTFFTDGNYGEAYPKSSDMTDSGSGIPFLTGGNLKDGKLSLDGASYITPEKHSKLTSGHLLEDDIVIAVRGSLGALGYVNTDNSGWNINSQLAILRTDKSELYGKFLIQYLLSWTGQNELLKRQTGSALKQLPIGAIKDVEVPITSIAEQGKIGEYFSNLDNLITLHQRKLEKLQNIKKAMLEKMFV